MILSDFAIILIDTDTASDDSVALLHALRQPDVEIVAITTVAGNLDVVSCTRNALSTIEIAGTYAPPVFMGATKPLVRTLFNSKFVHGSDGMGDMQLPDPSISALPGHAVNTIVTMARRYPGSLELIMLGPLTNLALALSLEPDLANLVKHVWIMGGSGLGPGNITPVAEFNVYADPEAVKIVLDSGIDAIFIGWDVSTNDTFVNADDMRRMDAGSPLSRFALRCNHSLIEHNRKEWKGRIGFDLPDPVAMLSALHPQIIRGQYQAFCEVSLTDRVNRGQLVIDRDGLLKKKPNATCISSIDATAFKQLLFESLSC